MDSLDPFERLKRSSLPVIICGAGMVGKELFAMLEKEGIRVSGFCDASSKVAGTIVCGKEVVYTPELASRFADAEIVISVASIGDAVLALNKQGFHRLIPGGLLLKERLTGLTRGQIDSVGFAIDNCVYCHQGFVEPDKLFIRSIDLIITERCSLKCRDCSNLMQYYQHPIHCDTERLLREVDSFSSIVDEIMDYRVIGGEAFVNPEWPRIVEHLTMDPKARRIVIYTNATLLPKAETIPILQHEKVLIIATDYGPLSRKLGQLRQLCEDNAISYNILSMDRWLDCSEISPHGRSEELSAELFEKCCAKNMTTLSDGCVFRCPFSANAKRLRAIPDYTDDYVDVCRKDLGKKELRKHLKAYLSRTSFLATCDFCKGRPLAGNEVEPAVQAREPFVYKMYR